MLNFLAASVAKIHVKVCLKIIIGYAILDLNALYLSDQTYQFSQNGMSGQKGKVHLGPNVSSSAHDRGCMVNGSGAMAAI